MEALELHKEETARLVEYEEFNKESKETVL